VALTGEEIADLVGGIVDGSVTDGQVAAFAMACTPRHERGTNASRSPPR